MMKRAYELRPADGRMDKTHGDRNLVCTCPPVESYMRPSA